MRSILLATLVLTPSLFHAQATSPAKTSAEPVLQARISGPADIKAVNPKNTVTSAIRVSTGIRAPKLLNRVDLSGTDGYHNRILAQDATIVVTMMVDAAGKPSDVTLAQSANNDLDKEVLAAITQSRFQPGTLDGQPFAIPVKLEVVLPRGTQY